MRTEAFRRTDTRAADAGFTWLPMSTRWRVVIGIAAIAFLSLTFAAYLRPNMVFDLANMIFCG